MDERELIEQITREVILRLQSEGALTHPIKPSATPLVILAGRFMESASMSEDVQALAQIIGDARIFHGEDEGVSTLPPNLEAQVVRAVKESELDALIESSTFISLPWLPLKTLSRLTHLEPECPVSLLLTKALMKGKIVRARKILLEPEVNLYVEQPISPIMRRIQQMVTEAKQIGIQWQATMAWEDLLQPLAQKKIKPGSKPLLTAADVERQKGQGVISIPKGTIVTPLAKDELKKHGLRLEMD